MNFWLIRLKATILKILMHFKIETFSNEKKKIEYILICINLLYNFKIIR